jgi:hypothetical protein
MPDMGVRRAMLVSDRWVEWNGEAWREVGSPRFLAPTPDDRLWLRLVCHQGRATKRWTFKADEVRWDKEGEAVGTWFDVEAVWVENTPSAWADLFARWDGNAFLVRGVLARGASFDGEPIRRAKAADKGAWLGPHPLGRRVIICDFDHIDAKAVVEDEYGEEWCGNERWPTVEEATRLVRAVIKARLPGRFWGAGAAYRWSASTGVPGGARGPFGWSSPSCHVALIVDRLVSDKALEAWLKGKADPAVARTVQPLYLTPPEFVGASSPWPEGWPRAGVLGGRDVTEAPEDFVDEPTRQRVADEAEDAARKKAEAAHVKAEARRVYAAIRGESDPVWAQAVDALERAECAGVVEELLRWGGDQVKAAKEGKRHDTVLRTAALLGRYVGGGVLVERQVESVLLQAWREVAEGREDGPRTIKDGVAFGKRRPRTWADIMAEDGA